MKHIISVLVLSLFLWNCSSERLSPNSVVEDNIVQKNQTELDTWIRDSITLPYGIAVEYRWNSNVAPKGSYSYPPNPKNVKAVLQAMKHLWLETYELPNLGKKDFMKGKNPLVIRMYGGKNIDVRGVELLDNPTATGAEMYIYNVDDFDAKDKDKVYVLMRSVHHQYAKKLAEIIPYNRDEFLVISQKKYIGSTEQIARVKDSYKDIYGVFKLSDFAHKRGFYTVYGTMGAEDDFAEIVSTTLTHTPAEITIAQNNAKTPEEDYGSDPEVQQRYNEEAKQSYKEFMEKQKFVNDYFEKKIKISLKRMQIASIQRIDDYVKKQNQ